MKRIIIFIIFSLIFIPKAFSEDTVWNIKDADFWTEIEQESKTLEEALDKRLDAQIELDFDTQDFDITLTDAINQGLENSNTYKISKLQKKYADWEFRNKLTEFLPDIGYNFMMNDLKGEFLVGGILPRKVHETVYSSTFTAEIELINGKRIFDIMRLKNQQREKKHSQNFSKNELIYNISNAYYDLLQKKFEIEVYQYNLIELEEQLKYNNALYDIGQGTRFDILRAQSEVEAAKADVQNAKFSMKISQTNLANIAGYPIFSNIKPKEKIINKLELVDENETPDLLFANAVKIREDVKAKRNSILALKAKRNSNFGDFLPAVSVTMESATVGTLRLGSRRNDTFGFMITVPLGKNLGLNSFTKYKMDDANYMIAKTELEKMLSGIQKKITDNYYGALSENEVINSKNKQVISTKEGLRQAIARMRVGEATYLDVIEAGRLKTQARIELINAIVNYNKIQINQLFETGRMNFFEIKEKYEKIFE